MICLGEIIVFNFLHENQKRQTSWSAVSDSYLASSTVPTVVSSNSMPANLSSK